MNAVHTTAGPEAEQPLIPRLASALFEIEANDPGHTSRRVLKVVCVLVAILVVWACIAKLDIVAVAQGRLVPQTYVKIVQPAEAGIIREILVEEGDLRAGGTGARASRSHSQCRGQRRNHSRARTPPPAAPAHRG